MNPRRGVYFLANDHVLDRAIAFLNSLRAFNPQMPLCLIPFSDDVDGLLAQRERFGFTVWSGDPALLRACDDLSRRFHDGVTHGHYRKLVAWEGGFDEFVYIDSDTVILKSLDFAFDHLGEYGFITGYAGLPDQRWLVWRDSAYGCDALTRQQIDFAAGTGLVASTKDALRFGRDVVPRIAAALRLVPHMNLMTLEMPLINYLMVTSGRPYTSLNLLRQKGLDVPLEHWAGVPFPAGGDPSILTVHWAGLWWQLERGEIADVPLAGLWRHYRHLHEDQLMARR